MNVITVIPMSRGIGKETLSYYTASPVELGSIVSVPLRSKMVEALVVSIADARSMKAELRSATFSLKKIDKLVSRPYLSPAFMKTVEDTARYHAATIGATLHVLLPKVLKKASTTYKRKEHVSEIAPRIARYLSLIAEEPNTVIVAPTKERQESLSKKVPVPIMLPSAVSTIPLDTSLIIIDETESTAYKSIGRPFIDFRFVIERYATHIGARIVKETSILDPHIKKIIDHHTKNDTTPYSSIGAHLEQELLSLKERPKHLFILGARKGHSGTVLCQDCGHIFNCTRCSAPLTLHARSHTERLNSLLCHHCGFKSEAATSCPTCGGWRLKAYGLGTQKIEEDVAMLVQKKHIRTYIQRIDSTLKLTPKRIREFITTHYSKPSAILIGTELLIPYLVDASWDGHHNDASYIASLDTLLALPDFSITDRIFHLFTQLDATTKKKVVLQTRSASYPLFDAWQRSTSDKDSAPSALSEFWKQEHELRKALSYSPFGTLIKITVRGSKPSVGAQMKKIEALLAPWKPLVFPAFIKTVRNQHLLHALITLPHDRESGWVNEELLTLLRSLPPSVIIDINPKSML